MVNARDQLVQDIWQSTGINIYRGGRFSFTNFASLQRDIGIIERVASGDLPFDSGLLPPDGVPGLAERARQIINSFPAGRMLNDRLQIALMRYYGRCFHSVEEGIARLRSNPQSLNALDILDLIRLLPTEYDLQATGLVIESETRHDRSIVDRRYDLMRTIVREGFAVLQGRLQVAARDPLRFDWSREEGQSIGYGMAQLYSVYSGLRCRYRENLGFEIENPRELLLQAWANRPSNNEKYSDYSDFPLGWQLFYETESDQPHSVAMRGGWTLHEEEWKLPNSRPSE